MSFQSTYEFFLAPDGDDDLIAVTHAENTVAVFLAHTECDNVEDAACCHSGTEWNGVVCEPCGIGTYGVGTGTSARCEVCPSHVCSITGLSVVPATCAGITGCANLDTSIALCSCPVDTMKDPNVDICVSCPNGMRRPDAQGLKRTIDSIGNYEAWELEQGVCAVPEQEQEVDRIGNIVVVGLVLIVIVIALALFLAIWTLRKRQFRILRESPPLSVVLIFSAAVLVPSAVVCLIYGLRSISQD